MTSGICFVFPGNFEKFILRGYRELSKEIKTDNESIKRFISFFKLNRAYGMEDIKWLYLTDSYLASIKESQLEICRDWQEE